MPKRKAPVTRRGAAKRSTAQPLTGAVSGASSWSETRRGSADVVPWRDVRPLGGGWAVRRAVVAPVARSGSNGEFPQIACESRGFPSVKHLPPTRPIYRLNISPYEADLSVKHLPPTHSTDQIVQPGKYVQAIGLFILGFSHTKKRPTEKEIEEIGGEIFAWPSYFLSKIAESCNRSGGGTTWSVTSVRSAPPRAASTARRRWTWTAARSARTSAR